MLMALFWDLYWYNNGEKVGIDYNTIDICSTVMMDGYTYERYSWYNNNQVVYETLQCDSTKECSYDRKEYILAVIDVEETKICYYY